MRRGEGYSEERAGRNGADAVPKANGGAGFSRQGDRSVYKCQECLWNNRLLPRVQGILQETGYKFQGSGNCRILESIESLWGLMDWRDPGLVQTPRTKANVCQLRGTDTKHIHVGGVLCPTPHFTSEKTEKD